MLMGRKFNQSINQSKLIAKMKKKVGVDAKGANNLIECIVVRNTSVCKVSVNLA